MNIFVLALRLAMELLHDILMAEKCNLHNKGENIEPNPSQEKSDWSENTRSSHGGCSVKKDVLRNFAKFTGKHLCQSLFLIKNCNFIKTETLAQVFSREFCEIFWNTFFTEHLWVTASKKHI